MTSQVQPLDVQMLPLRGSHLIEASAGTGKTWTIAALYVRLVLGHGSADASPPRPMLPQDLLVMTFTRAATRELSDRIRARLTEAAQVFRGVRSTHDDFLTRLVAAYPAGQLRDQAAYRLAFAAQAMDDAAVYTIDAWCQRVLREHAFDSGNLFEENLVGDEAALRLQAVQDYWRQQIYPMTAQQVGQVLGIWPTVDELESDMRALMAVPLPEVAPATLAEVLAHATHDQSNRLQALKQGWDERADNLLGWIQAQLASQKHAWDGKKLQNAKCQQWLATLKNWAQGSASAQSLKESMKTGWERFTPSGLGACRKPGAGAFELPPESHAYAELQADLKALPDPAHAARLHARTHVLQRMAELKRRNRQFGFADMLRRLDTALAQPVLGERLAQRLREQFPVAMIDEFQDTSPLQFRIFDRIYHTAANRQDLALLLIGDPKQSIYGFRGADIQSYLAARRATTGRHHVLTTNYRSTPEVVAVVNRWFQIPHDAFGYRTEQDDPLPFVPVQAHGRQEVFFDSQGPVKALVLVHDHTLRSHRDACAYLSDLCAEQIVTWLNDPMSRFAHPVQGDTRLQPRDIAVLVRTGTEATAMRDALRRRGVASVYLSDRDSVFASPEAADLCLWLRGVAEPQNMRRVRAALGARTVGLSLTELHDLATQDEWLDHRAEQLRELNQTWQSQGVLAMLRQSLHLLQLPARWRGQADGDRRLTNVLHLAELLQTASTHIEGEHALIRWLAKQVDEARSGTAGEVEEQTVRLESDEGLVKVVTVHKSKGLEYPVVCLPFAHSHRPVTAEKSHALLVGDQLGNANWTLAFDKDDAQAADQHRLREDVRLWYVALTRARHALWVGWSPVNRHNGTLCVNHDSAPGRLLGGSEQREPAEWEPRLQLLKTGTDGSSLSVALVPAPPQVPLTPWQPPVQQPELRPALVCTANVDTSWGIASFSRLTRDLPNRSLMQLPLARPADDEPPESGLPDVVFADAPRAQAGPWHGFPKGPTAGNFLHEQLEWLAADGFALDQSRAARLKSRCERSAYKPWADELVFWLKRVVERPLQGLNAPLNDLGSVLPEMEFWLPAGRLPAREVDALCQRHLLPGVARPALPDARLHGMLMGFVDLVFEHDGRYWVLDYKSNRLGNCDADYTADVLNNAMAQHRYDVQAALYLLALHRLLRARLGSGYDPAQHLGGAVYLFLRGIDGPTGGCCTLPAPLDLLKGLDATLNGPSTTIQEGA